MRFPFIYALACAAAMAHTGACAQPATEQDPAPMENATDHKHTNHLINETSPYLLQHAHNPVDWYPWGDEAIAKAKEESKPIFLSIGYSACHWCHVMEHESFENEEVAEVLNEYFVSIKVDREERPDLDDIYMGAVQAMTGQGGWPMTVFLTPELKPFYGGTYFPPEDRFGRPGFKSLVSQIAKLWADDPQRLMDSADKLTEILSEHSGFRGDGAEELSDEPFTTALSELKQDYDLKYGGWGGAPKFPSGPTLDLLLRRGAANGDDAAIGMALETLRKMAEGGMYDHLGGGFHRYSVDEKWLVPHFEKMLYDNAQLAPVYIDAYQLTGDSFYLRIAKETLDYVLHDMFDPKTAFYSTEDADSEGEEGKFYVWTRAEIESILGKDDADVFCAYYNVEPNGNFDSHEPYHAGQNILHVTRPISEVAGDLGLSEDELESKLVPMRAKLLEVRNKRVRPGLDDKIIAAWNGLMITAMARGYAATGDGRYKDAAEQAAGFILKEMRWESGMLYRTYRNGEAKHIGYLDDHANLANGLVDLYEVTGDIDWLKAADEIASIMIREFADPEGAGFYATSDEHTHLISRQKPAYDGSEPSGNSMAAWALVRLAKFRDDEDYYNRANGTMRANFDTLRQHPRALMKMLCVLDFATSKVREIAVVGHEDSDSMNAMLSVLNNEYVPNKVVAIVYGDSATAAMAEATPLLAAKVMIGGKATAYVCENFACKAPVTDPVEFKKQIAIK